MDLQTVVAWLTGGGGIVALVSAYLTHRAKKSDHDLNLIDRLSAELKRVYLRIEELEKALEESEKEVEMQRETIIKQSFTITREVEKFERAESDNLRLREIIKDLKDSVEIMQEEIKALKGDR